MYIIISILRLMKARITSNRSCQIDITKPKYNFYPKAWIEKQILYISKLNTTTTHFLICYKVDIEKKIKINKINIYYNLIVNLFLNKDNLKII